MKGTRTVLRREGGSNPSDLADSLDICHEILIIYRMRKQGAIDEEIKRKKTDKEVETESETLSMVNQLESFRYGKRKE